MQRMNEIEFSSENCKQLGAVLTEVRQKHIDSWLATIISLVGTLSTVAVLYYVAIVFSNASLWMQAIHTLAFWLILVSMLGGTFALASSFGGERCLYVHENGVRLLQARKETKISHSQLEQFSFKKTKMYKDVYQAKYFYGICFELEFKSKSKHSIKWRGYISTGQGYYTDTHSVSDSIDYDELILHHSQIVAKNLASRLEMSQEIPFGKSAFIRKTGVDIKRKTGFLSSKMTFVPWSDLKDIQFRDGHLTVAVSGPQSAHPWIAIMNCNEVNILPGYLLIKGLLESQTSRAEISDQSQVEIVSAMAGEYTTPYMTPVAG